MTLPTQTPLQLFLTQELNVEYHKRHREFWEKVDAVEKWTAFITLSAAFASLTKLIPATVVNGPYIGVVALIAAMLTAFTLIRNASERAYKAARLQSAWENLREAFPTETHIAKNQSAYLTEKAKIKDEPHLPALRNEIFVELCHGKGFRPPPNTKMPNLIRRVFKHVF
ncbi:MAG TPA: hypothetical protein VE934_09005 [Polaromonas sp.]|uniref:hypothetical protein n=1 Tax=Polaromonas sp. TaxID=1869339 RepID=UPI002D5043C2|nr:hypothetical protein [Polaromonas sp.]HYW57087.1 hypothetical protein [Polaromonas sp.]